MSLYGVQKILYRINRDTGLQDRFKADPDAAMDGFPLSDEERGWLRDGEIGELYIHGVNGQILMHFAAFLGLEWNEYIDAMKDGLSRHGQVKGGLYKAVDGGSGGAV
ncbi:MAG: aromatic ring-opening dioxygenase subunit LigA [Pseudomonadota bacterium]